VLRPDSDKAKVKAVTAMRVLVDNGLTLLKAKRAVEAMLASGKIEVRLPTVRSLTGAAAQLGAAGIRVAQISGEPVDVRALRVRLGLSQEQFSLQFNIPLATLRHWEQGRELDQAANSYLRVIMSNPVAASKAQEQLVE
jgi:DNA-binding transcriptional regulator YiaG